MTHAAVCTVCDLREEAEDYVAASLVVEEHEEKTGHEVDVLPVGFENGDEVRADGGKYECW